MANSTSKNSLEGVYCSIQQQKKLLIRIEMSNIRIETFRCHRIPRNIIAKSRCAENMTQIAWAEQNKQIEFEIDSVQTRSEIRITYPDMDMSVQTSANLCIK